LPYIRLISLSKEDFENQEQDDGLDRFSLNDDEEEKHEN